MSNESHDDFHLEIPRKVDFNLKYQLNDFDYMNNYDLEQSMKKFKQMDDLNKHKKELLKPIKKQNKIWKRNVEKCYEQKQFLIDEQVKKIKEKMHEKENKVKELLIQNQSARSKEKEKMIQKAIEQQEKIQNNLEKYYKMVEQDRLQQETKVFNKLQGRSIRQAEHIREIFEKFHDRNESSKMSFLTCMNRLDEEQKEKEKQDKENKFNRFMKWYFFYQDLKKEKKKKQDKQNQVRQRCADLQREMEEDHEKMRLETDMNLKHAEEKRKEKMEERKKELKKKVEEDEKHRQNTLYRKKQLLEMGRHERHDLLKVQMDRVLNSYQKDRSMHINRCNIQ